MFEEKATTAKAASQIYMKLQKRNSDLWAENLNTAVQNLDPSQEVLFYKFLADPMGRTGLKNKDVGSTPMREVCIFDNTDIYERTEVVPGVVPCIKLNYLPSFRTSQDDEKISMNETKHDD
jgi:hypothetical protein